MTDDATVQAIFKNILSGDAKQWQCQLNSNGNALTGFNLAQVSAICDEENVLTPIPKLIEALDMFKASLPNKDQSGIFWAEKFRQYLVELK